MSDHRRFYLQRDTDITGISGTGRIADGVLWADGTVSLRWRSSTPKIDFADGGMATIESVHCHGGATRIVWVDPEVCELPHQTVAEEEECESRRSYRAPKQPAWDAFVKAAEKAAREVPIWESCDATDTLNGKPVHCIYPLGHSGHQHWDDAQEKLWERD